MNKVLDSASHICGIENSENVAVADLEIAEHGAYLRRFNNINGSDIIYPAQLSKAGKLRGGVFLTLPQFGPDERDVDAPQNQHGFARNVRWRLRSGAPNAFTFEYRHETGEYAGLGVVLRYEAGINDDNEYRLLNQVIATNKSDRELRIAPGVHPYFAVGEQDLEDYLSRHELSPTGTTIEANTHKVEFQSGHSIEVVSDYGFEYMTLWNGGDGNYLCVEPSAAGPSFKTNPDNPLEAEIIAPGEERRYAARFIIRTSQA